MLALAALSMVGCEPLRLWYKFNRASFGETSLVNKQLRVGILPTRGLQTNNTGKHVFKGTKPTMDFGTQLYLDQLFAIEFARSHGASIQFYLINDLGRVASTLRSEHTNADQEDEKFDFVIGDFTEETGKLLRLPTVQYSTQSKLIEWCPASINKKESHSSYITAQDYIAIGAGRDNKGAIDTEDGHINRHNWEITPLTHKTIIRSIIKSTRKCLSFLDSHRPQLEAHFPAYGYMTVLSQGHPRAWLVSPAKTDLADQLSTWIQSSEASNYIKEMQALFIEPYSALKLGEGAEFLRQVKALPKQILSQFKAAAQLFRLDWRLLVAMAYQESKFNPAAISQSGAQGIMQLMGITQAEMQVADPFDTEQNIHGGAGYLRARIDSLRPGTLAAKTLLKEHGALALALAAYNVGPGHLKDAQIILDNQNENPTLWANLRMTLPRLKEQHVHSTTKYGYARGDEPVLYTERVLSFFGLLRRP